MGTLSGSCWAWRHVTTCAATTQLPLVLAAMDIWYQNRTNVHVACYSVDTIPINNSPSRSPPEAVAFTFSSYHAASQVALHSRELTYALTVRLLSPAILPHPAGICVVSHPATGVPLSQNTFGLGPHLLQVYVSIQISNACGWDSV